MTTLGYHHSPETRAAISAARLGHGHAQHGRESTEYESWRGAKARTSNPNHADWPYYGGRGISMCAEWRDSFPAFLADMGPRPPGTSIDRIDNDGSYSPGNCRWSTRKEQRRNQRPRHQLQAAA